MPTPKRDYYEVLSVPRDAQLKADRASVSMRLACTLPPGPSAKSPMRSERFKEASEAYAVLSDRCQATKIRRSAALRAWPAIRMMTCLVGLDLGSLFAGHDLELWNRVL